jgi:transglutaminase-like putative cysteine protease
LKIVNDEKFYLRLINNLLAVIFSFCVIIPVAAIFKLPMNPILAAVIATVIVFAFDLAVKNRKNAKIAGIAILSAFGISFIISLISGGPAKFFTAVPDSFKWFARYNSGFENYNAINSSVILALAIIIVCLFTYAAIRVINFHLLASASAAVAISASYIILGKVDIGVFLLFCAAFILTWYFNFYSSMAKGKGKDNKLAPIRIYAVWIAALSTIIFVSAYLLPVSSMPVQIKWLDQKINEIIAAREKTTFVKFNFSEIFTKNKDYLGSPIVRNELLVMTVVSPRYVYLKGNISDVYTGNSWLSSDNRAVSYSTALTNDLKDDAFEFEKGIIYLNNGVVPTNDFYIKDSISVKFNRIKTQTIFYSLKPLSFGLSKSVYDKLLLSPNGDVLTGRSMTTGFTYDYTAYSINYASDSLAALLRKSTRAIYNAQLALPENSSFQTEDLIGLKKRSEDIYAKYLQLPANYSKKVIDLAYSVTANASNSYDKAKAIENYLSTSFLYNEKPKIPDPTRDFIEQFLFEIKSGYCVHYASSMTIMLRAIGIPARYVEGYMLPDKSEPDKITYKVTNKRAHAWVEAYFPGFGWVMFEPTSSITDSFYSNTMQSYQNFRATKTPTPRPSITPIVVPPTFSPTDEPRENDTPLVPWTPSKTFIVVILSVVGAILLIGLLILFLYLFNSRRVKNLMARISISSSNEAVMFMAARVFKLLDMLNLRIQPTETAFEYLARLLQYKELKKANIENCIEIFVMARYSSHKLPVTDKNAMLKSYNAILNYYIMSSGKFKYFIMRFILGRI